MIQFLVEPLQALDLFILRSQNFSLVVQLPELLVFEQRQLLLAQLLHLFHLDWIAVKFFDVPLELLSVLFLILGPIDVGVSGRLLSFDDFFLQLATQVFPLSLLIGVH